jgi:hypothetical protein
MERCFGLRAANTGFVTAAVNIAEAADAGDIFAKEWTRKMRDDY